MCRWWFYTCRMGALEFHVVIFRLISSLSWDSVGWQILDFVSSSSQRSHPHVASVLLVCQMCMSMCVWVVCVKATDIKNNTHINIILHPVIFFALGQSYWRQLVHNIFLIFCSFYIFVIFGEFKESISLNSMDSLVCVCLGSSKPTGFTGVCLVRPFLVLNKL